MVSITIYVEGGNQGNNNKAAQTFDNSALFREGFHKLFAQQFDENEFNLVIQPIGSVTQSRNYLAKVIANGAKGAILIDLDGPKTEKESRLQDNYSDLDTTCLFFMIQEMEGWILSQPAILDDYGQAEGYTRKRPGEKIEDDNLLKDKHPEDLTDPAGKLNTLFRKYFAVEKIRRGKPKSKPKSYSKSKDGPKLIGSLELNSLKETFDEAESLIHFLQEENN